MFHLFAEGAHLPRVEHVRHEQVAALADLVAHFVPAEAHAELRERLDPAPRVEVVGVDERAVDVEDGRAEGHGEVGSKNATGCRAFRARRSARGYPPWPRSTLSPSRCRSSRGSAD